MPWNRVVKTVKGRAYAYLQRSFRDGASVRTQSRYLGPAGSSADLSATSLLAITYKSAGSLRLRFSPEARNLSSDRLRREYARVREWAQGLGVPPERFPRIVLREGRLTGFRRSWSGNGLVVTMGRADGRKAVRKEYADALGRAFLESVREANPGVTGDCQEFRVRAGIMGKKEIAHAPTETPEHPGRVAGCVSCRNGREVRA